MALLDEELVLLQTIRAAAVTPLSGLAQNFTFDEMRDLLAQQSLAVYVRTRPSFGGSWNASNLQVPRASRVSSDSSSLCLALAG